VNGNCETFEVTAILEVIDGRLARIEQAITKLRPASGAAPGTPSRVPNRKSKKVGKRGRPVDTDLKADERIMEAWSTGGYNTCEQLAKALGKKKRDVKLALDRHRKRCARRPK